jgi:hypothetical protein
MLRMIRGVGRRKVPGGHPIPSLYKRLDWSVFWRTVLVLSRKPTIKVELVNIFTLSRYYMMALADSTGHLSFQ